jgi:WD40 repeat protein
VVPVGAHASEAQSPLVAAIAGQSPPVNLTAPQIAGVLRAGKRLRASHGTWAPRAQSYEYSWRRCGAAGCRAIAGATAAVYALREADVGRALQVSVVAVGRSGRSTAALSPVTATVPGRHGPRPVNLAAPTIAGGARPGQQLSASSGVWSNAPLLFEYEWQRCDPQGQSCAPIALANAAAYTVSQADMGSTLRVAVIASNAAGESEPAVSSVSALVSSTSPPENLSPPVLAGAAQTGRQLSASPGSWAGAPASFAYKWRRCNARGIQCRRIASASGARYTVTSSDVGSTLRVTVIASNAAGHSAPAASAPSAVVTEAHGEAPVNVTPPVISGLTQQGQVLSAAPGTWSNSPSAYQYAWSRCNRRGNACVAIAGAGAAGYALGSADVGSTLRVTVIASNAAGASEPAVSQATGVVSAVQTGTSHYEYVFNDGPVNVYDIDNSFRLVESFTLPGASRGVRGVAVSPVTHMMFVSYGGDGGGNGDGSVLAYDLVAKRVVWSVNLASGIDSGAVSADGRLLYMPDGELSSDGVWNILSSANGQLLGKIETHGSGPHDGVVSADGKILLLGDRNYNYLPVYNTLTGKVQAEVGPLVGGVRPNTINGSDTIAFTTATGFDGFQVESITPPGAVLYTESFGACSGPFSTCSHGISLSPDNRQAYVIDSVHKAVQVWDVHGVGAGVAPVHVATVPVDGLEGEEEGCAYDCARDGWLHHSLDGRYVFVGDSGAVIETATQKVVARIPAMLNTRKFVEIDWAAGVPVASSGRQGIGYGP